MNPIDDIDEDEGFLKRWGVCPLCQQRDGFITHHKAHWGVCDTHKMRWYFGSGLMTYWHHQTEEERAEEEAKYKAYMPVARWDGGAE